MSATPAQAGLAAASWVKSPRAFIAPLALAQFVSSLSAERLGVMLTPSVNLVQSAFREKMQGEISGLSRSVSNLGSSFGTPIALEPGV